MKILTGFLARRLVFISNNNNQKKTRPFRHNLIEFIFSVITHKVIGANILELFAGSSICSFESLSRGAKSLCLVENKKSIIECLHKNIEILNIKNNVKIFYNNITTVTKKIYTYGLKYDIIFLDPPYNLELSIIFLNLLIRLMKNRSVFIHRSSKNSYDIKKSIYKRFKRSIKIKIKKNVYCFII